MLRPMSPGSKTDRRTGLGVAAVRSHSVLSSRGVAGASTSGNRTNGHSRVSSDSRELLYRVHKISRPASPSLSTVSSSSSPPHPRHPPKRPSSLPDSSNILPDGFDASSIDSASVASADSAGQPRVRRLCSPENSRPSTYVQLRRRRRPAGSRSPSPSKDLGDNYAGPRLTEQALRDRRLQEANIRRGDLDDTVPNTPTYPQHRTTLSTPEKLPPKNFEGDSMMPSSPPEQYGASRRTSSDRPRSSASTYSDPTQKREAKSNVGPGFRDRNRRATLAADTSGIEQEIGARSQQQDTHGADNLGQGGASMAFRRRQAREPRFGRRTGGPGPLDPDADGRQSKPSDINTAEGLKGRTKTAEMEKKPPSSLAATSRAEERAKPAHEHLVFSSNTQKPSSITADTRAHLRTFSRGNSLPKDSKGLSDRKQPTPTFPSPSPDRPPSRRDKYSSSKPDASPTPAKQRSQTYSHKRNATTSQIGRECSGERQSAKLGDGRSTVSSATLAKSTATVPVSTTSAPGMENFQEVTSDEALVAETNFEGLSAGTTEMKQKASHTTPNSSRSSWTDVLSDSQDDPRPRNAMQMPELSPEINSPDTKATLGGLGGFNQSFLKRPSEDDYEDLALAENKQKPRYTPTPSPSKRRDTRKKNVSIGRSLNGIKLARRSRLEDDDSDVDSLEYLMENDHDFSALFTPPGDDEDDTELLLASLPRHRSAEQVRVRPRSEAEAGDQQHERERAVQEKLMNRLRTLHLEVRSASRGIEVLEDYLGETGSSGDLSECWDDAAQRKEYMRRLRKEEQNQRLILERRMRRRIALLGTPLPWNKWMVKWGFILFLFVILWYLLELAVFLHQMPPSYSSIAIKRKPPPEFGSVFAHTILNPAKFAFNTGSWILRRGVLIGVQFAWTLFLEIFGSCRSIISTIFSYSWRAATTTSGSSASEAVYADAGIHTGIPQALGTDQVLN